MTSLRPGLRTVTSRIMVVTPPWIVGFPPHAADGS